MPSGYQKVSYSDPLALNSNDEVWLVQIPNAVDIKDAKVVNENEIVVGSTTYSLKATDMPVGDCEVLIPDTSSILRTSKTRPSKLMTLTKRVGLPKIDYDEARIPKPRVEQVKNLRMRHFPTGYSAKSFGIGSEEPRKLPKEPKSPKVKSTKPTKPTKSPKKDKKEKKDRKEKKSKRD